MKETPPEERPPFGNIQAAKIRSSIRPGTPETDKIIRSLSVDRSEEEMVVWAEMKLARVNVDATVLASLLTAAYKYGYEDGNSVGYSEGSYWAGK